MIIPVVSDGKKLIESGVFNSIFNNINESQLQFVHDGLVVKLVISAHFDNPLNLPANQLPSFTAAVENGEVMLRQPVRCNENTGVTNGFAAMLVPLEIGVKNNGKKIYMSWTIGVARSIGGVLVATTHYSFYEDV
ncbi:hypothetical protein RJO42_002100 [Enterobacter hormaechei]|uniref:hypothetical protein n=1 Tax=Enterobacter cloacae complex TaxID=354276 RepID=UPI00100F4455|nr:MULTISPECIES: hypothetical protein [Enterobacter cloacae complex]EKK5517373.1 hypothetical protein [Enterobacter hormaechei]ELC6571584.1 hypothetical protein [Enterobacter hormaechei]MCW6019491.1 hypothetical protein [Enterobacter hormaechei subsp. xiangfangensis]MCW6042025.1 hypothetical protein [Enterobacter hormaechei subsp. xiangfangensis]MCW6046759.1 hypothetical protein [Enterobacter hormaechei subsp. xiangfangensis]